MYCLKLLPPFSIQLHSGSSLIPFLSLIPLKFLWHFLIIFILPASGLLLTPLDQILNKLLPWIFLFSRVFFLPPLWFFAKFSSFIFCFSLYLNKPLSLPASFSPFYMILCIDTCSSHLWREDSGKFLCISSLYSHCLFSISFVVSINIR